MAALKKSEFARSRTHFITNYTPSPLKVTLKIIHSSYKSLLKSLYPLSGGRFNFWGFLVATGVKL